LKICDDDKGVVATNDQGSKLLKPSWSNIESEGGSFTWCDGVIEPGSDGGVVGFAVSPEAELWVVLTVGTIRIVDGIQSLSLEVGGVTVSAVV
jgi:hypothetical protein